MNDFGEALSYLMNSLGLQGRIQITELSEGYEFTFDTKDVFDFDEYGSKRAYVIEKGK